MEIKRRRFLRLALGFGTAMSASMVWLAERTLPVRYVEALRARFYPGPSKRLDDAEIAKPAPWQG